MKKFYEIKNITDTSADIYIYGEIVLEKYVDWWTGEESKTDVDLFGFKEELDKMGNVDTINLYVNSPGGSVFVASTMVSMLRRKKEKGTKINAYIDALAASAASFLIMIADNIHIYKNSMIMVHKPIVWAFGNANDLQKSIDMLNQVEESTIIPMYMDKAKVDEEEIRELIKEETWLGAEDIEKYFNVIVEEEEKTVAACVSKEIFSRYKNVPKELVKDSIEEVETQEDTKPEETQGESKTEVNNVKKEELIRNKLKLIDSSLFIKQNKEKEGN